MVLTPLHSAKTRSAKNKFMCAILPFIFYLMVFCAVYFPVLSTVYGFRDDYGALVSSLIQDNWPLSLLKTLMPLGRPADVLLQWLYFSIVKYVFDLQLLRLAGIIGLAVLSTALHCAFKTNGWPRAIAMFAPIIISTLPSFQVYAAWSIISPDIFVAAATAVSVYLIDRAQTMDKLVAKMLYAVLSVLVLFICLTVHQSLAMFFWMFAAITLFKPDGQGVRIASRLPGYLCVFTVACGLELALYELGKWLFYVPGIMKCERSMLVRNLLGKASWFVLEPLKDALNIGAIFPLPWVAFVVGSGILLGLFLFFQGDPARRIKMLTLALALLPLSYLPNIVVWECFASYRTQVALAALVVFYAICSLWALSRSGAALSPASEAEPPAPNEPRSFHFAASFLVTGAAAASCITAWSNVYFYLVLPQVLEARIMQAALLSRPSAICALRCRAPYLPSLTGESRYDEFGFPNIRVGSFFQDMLYLKEHQRWMRPPARSLFDLMLSPVAVQPVHAHKTNVVSHDAWLDKFHKAVEEQWQGDYQSGEYLWRQALMAAGQQPAGNSARAETLYCLAQFYRRRRQYSKAISTLVALIDLKERHPEKTYFYMPWHYCELADLYFGQKNYIAAFPWYVSAVNAWENTRRWPELIPALDKLGNCLAALNHPAAGRRYDEALAVWRKSRFLSGLERERYLMDVFAAQTMEDYASLLEKGKTSLRAAALRARAASIRRELEKVAADETTGGAYLPIADMLKKIKRDGVHIPTSCIRKIKLLSGLAVYYCRCSKYFESETLYDAMMELISGSAAFACTDNLSMQKELIVGICQSERLCKQVIVPSSSVPARGRCPDSYEKPGIYRRSSRYVRRSRGGNQYLDEFSRLKSKEEFYSRRTALVSKYAYAVPTDEALDLIARYQPIVEIGAGTGYWDYLLKRRGVKVVAYERYPLSAGENAWFPQASKSWTEVLPGDETVVKNYRLHTLFLCYPPGQTDVAYNALRAFRGKYLIYIGESAGVAPGHGQDAFQNLLRKQWQQQKKLQLPQWPGLYDSLYIYGRKR